MKEIHHYDKKFIIPIHYVDDIMSMLAGGGGWVDRAKLRIKTISTQPKLKLGLTLAICFVLKITKISHMKMIVAFMKRIKKFTPFRSFQIFK